MYVVYVQYAYAQLLGVNWTRMDFSWHSNHGKGRMHKYLCLHNSMSTPEDHHKRQALATQYGGRGGCYVHVCDTHYIILGSSFFSSTPLQLWGRHGDSLQDVPSVCLHSTLLKSASLLPISTFFFLVTDIQWLTASIVLRTCFFSMKTLCIIFYVTVGVCCPAWRQSA